jgi:2-methylcitrate dehydratase PrpD
VFMTLKSQSEILSDFAVSLKLNDIPIDVLNTAKFCIIDTIGVSIFGSQFPWSQKIATYAKSYGSGGKSQILGSTNTRLHAPYAALVNGAFAHAFEQDSLRKPGAGVHPGATLFPPALAIGQEMSVGGETLLRSFIAGCEVMFRIGSASKHSSEKLGFHAPGLTGVFGAAVSAGLVQGLDSLQLSNALGIAGSLSSGLLAFTKSTRGSEVKRLHLGKACESGVLASRLAYEGFEGPETILEGKFGFLDTFCSSSDSELLTKNLGTEWETSKICLKAYPCHITAHPLIHSLYLLMNKYSFSSIDIQRCDLLVSEKILTHHDIREPRDIKQAQYSVPFCLAIAMDNDASDPSVFCEEIVNNPNIINNCKKITMTAYSDALQRNSWTSTLKVLLKNGSEYIIESDGFVGSPENPLSISQLKQRFLHHTQKCKFVNAENWFNAFLDLENLTNLNQLPDLF